MHIILKNISEKEFLKYKTEWLIKNANLNLIEDYLVKNQVFDLHPKLSRFLLDYYLANANLNKSCDIILKKFRTNSR